MLNDTSWYVMKDERIKCRECPHGYGNLGWRVLAGLVPWIRHWESLDQQTGIHWQMICGIRLFTYNISDRSWENICSLDMEHYHTGGIFLLSRDTNRHSLTYFTSLSNCCKQTWCVTSCGNVIRTHTHYLLINWNLLTAHETFVAMIQSSCSRHLMWLFVSNVTVNITVKNRNICLLFISLILLPQQIRKITGHEYLKN